MSLNKTIIQEIQQQKAKNALRPARNYSLVAILVGLIYAGLVVYFLNFTYPFTSVFTQISIAIHLLVTLIAIAMYIRQLCRISEINQSENVVQMQQKLAKLQSSTVKIVGISLLQLPVFSTWNISFELINEQPTQFWFIQMPIVLLFTFAGIWLYKNMDIKNMDKKWFKIIFYGSEWSALVSSGKFLKEIERFEKE